MTRSARAASSYPHGRPRHISNPHGRPRHISHFISTKTVNPDIQTISSFLAVNQDNLSNIDVSKHELLVEVSANRFRFCVIDAAKQLCVGLEDYALDGLLLGNQQMQPLLEQIYRQHSLLSSQVWKNVWISFNTPHFTLVPEVFFRKEYAESYLQLVKGNTASESEQILNHCLETPDAQNIFTADRALREWFLNTYTLQIPTFLHQTSALIYGTLQLSVSKEIQTCLTLYFEDDFLTLVLARADKLLFCNKFAYKSAADMVYFVLFVLETLHFKPSSVNAFLYGEITPFSDDYQSLQRFLPNLSFGNSPANLGLSADFDDLPEHRYFSLYSIYLSTPQPVS